MGAEDEPALTAKRFSHAVADWLDRRQDAGKTYGFAIIEEGEFQVVIGAFERNRSKQLSKSCCNASLVGVT